MVRGTAAPTTFRAMSVVARHPTTQHVSSCLFLVFLHNLFCFVVPWGQIKVATCQLLGAHKCSSSYHNYIVIPDDMKLYTHCTDCECMDGLLHLEGTCQFPLLCTNCNSHSSTASLLVCIAMQCLHSPATWCSTEVLFKLRNPLKYPVPYTIC